MLQIGEMDDEQIKQANAKSASDANRPSAAGGVFIALGTVFGTIFGGFAFGQPSAGFVVGLVGGALVAMFIALNDNVKR